MPQSRRSRTPQTSIDDVLELLVVQTRSRFVEKQELELAGDGAGNLQASLQAIGQLLRQAIADRRETHLLQSRAGDLAAVSGPASHAAATSTVSSAVNVAARRIFWKVRRMPIAAAERERRSRGQAMVAERGRVPPRSAERRPR